MGEHSVLESALHLAMTHILHFFAPAQCPSTAKEFGYIQIIKAETPSYLLFKNQRIQHEM